MIIFFYNTSIIILFNNYFVSFPAMRKVFQMFDQGKTGFVECSKFVNILNTLGQTFDEEELKTAIEKNDPDSKLFLL